MKYGTDPEAICNLLTLLLSWRRGWDSNPRYGLSPYNGLANRRLQPLGHPSTNEWVDAGYRETVVKSGSRRVNSPWFRRNTGALAPPRFCFPYRRPRTW